MNSEESLQALQLAARFAEEKQFLKALPILRKLLQSTSPVRGAHLLYSKLISNISFNYLALEAARKEYDLFGCTDANNLALSLTQEALNKQKSITGLPLISFIVVAREGEENDWQRCFESLTLQMHANFEVCLVSHSPGARWGTLPTFVKRYAPESSPLCLRTEISRLVKFVQGTIVSVIERPRTIFSDPGTVLVASAFSNDSGIKVLQSERVYAHETLVFELNRFSYPEWSQSLVLEPATLQPPSLMISWKGLFFRKDTLQELLPFDSRINHALAMDLVSKHLRRGQVFTIKVPTVLDDTPSEARSYALTPLEVEDAQLLIERERALLIGGPSREAPTFINPQPVGQLNQNMPKVQRSLLAFGRAQRPSISIVTAVFNCKDYLERCIDSILSQGYPNLEYMILDGGSTDGTQQIIQKYQRHLSFWRSAPDDGHYSALQEGFQRSSGAIMSWLNADDYLAPYSLDLVATIFSKMEEVHWLTGSHCMMLANGTLSVGETPLLTGEKYFDDGFDRPFLQQEGTFWRRALWNQSGASLNLQLELAADMELWTRFFQYEQPYVTSVPLGIFRVRPGQRSDIFRNRYYNEAYEVIRTLKANGIKPFNHPSPDSTRLAVPVE